MCTDVKMFGGVFVFGGITATDVAAFHANAQVQPGVASFQALFAALRRWFYVVHVLGAGVCAAAIRLGFQVDGNGCVNPVGAHERGLLERFPGRCTSL